jgi:transposase-like protein
MKTMLTLAEATKLTEETARQYIENLLWPDGPVCPRCKGKNAIHVAGESARAGRFICNDCRREFTATAGTIFEGSHIPLRSWIIAFHMLCASKKGVSAKQVQRQLGLASYKTAWFMCRRIRGAMEKGPLTELLKGILERNGKMRTRAVAETAAPRLKGAIGEAVDRNAGIITDEFASAVETHPPTLEQQFDALAAQWYRETRKLSDATQIVLHPAYQKIIGMGKDALPFIFRELKRTRGHWLWALAMITRQDQAQPGQAFRQAVDSWLRWGEKIGYV